MRVCNNVTKKSDMTDTCTAAVFVQYFADRCRAICWEYDFTVIVNDGR